MSSRSLLRLGQVLRGVVPPFLFQVLRRGGTGVITPVLFSVRTGHLRSTLVGRSVDAAGEPVPSYSYPALDLLGSKDFAGRSVLEWGAGQSTLWWAARASHVTAFENDARWYRYLDQQIPGNVVLHLQPYREGSAAHLVEGQRFDVVVVDGWARHRCTEESIPLVADDGVIIFDNSDEDRNQDWNGALDLLREEGFQRVDFYGFAPGVVQPQCTSFFFRERCFLFRGEEKVRRVVV